MYVFNLVDGEARVAEGNRSLASSHILDRLQQMLESNFCQT